ncbi:uncharacterized protein LOC131311709 [Rhododendron vialii]|uniref:uncharacterized protein LOC131311709 n=1 Tax=Rhododendron vialii TaxID=182163 RepID=UPI00265FADF6|nr:uncharacterized protein LOC131311709 [Rhododendron vialii]
MAHYTTSRRPLAATDPKTPMDPTNRKQSKSPSFTTSTKPHQDPNPTNPSSTIHSLTKKFSNLYTNPNQNKALPPHKSSNPPSKPSVDTQFQSKSMAVSVNEDASGKTHLKSSHQHRKSVLEMEKDRLRASITGSTDHKYSKKSHEGCEIKDLLEIDIPKTERIKKSSKKGREKMESHEGCDIKRALVSLSRSQEFELKESHENMRRASFSVALSGGGGGRRRSICNPQAELGDFLRVNGVKIVSVDMPPFMQVHAVDCARKAHDSLEKFTSKTLALSLKKEFDGVYGPAWHCIVGASFGSFVTHSVGGFMYFSMDQKLYILLFKTTVQRAD